MADDPDELDLPSVDAITVGTVGEPGQRVFYVQIWTAGRIVSLKLEKQQIAALSIAVAELLADLPPTEPNVAPTIIDPGEPDWIVGSMALTAYDEDERCAFLVLHELVREEDEVGARARLGLTLPQLASLVSLGEESVEGGRLPCPLCGLPMDPNGHSCPKTNGSAKH
jgi:uncharacterized repeat protein (TIGR03847 family)